MSNRNKDSSALEEIIVLHVLDQNISCGGICNDTIDERVDGVGNEAVKEDKVPSEDTKYSNKSTTKGPRVVVW